MACGKSVVSACTVALMPSAASAPRTTPQGNQRNYQEISRLSVIQRKVELAYRFSAWNRIHPGCSAHPRERLEEVVREHVDPLAYQVSISLFNWQEDSFFQPTL